MADDDQLVYLDVAVAQDRVYALYAGGSAAGGELASRITHVFALGTGEFLGQMRLPIPGRHFARRDSLMALLDYSPAPTIHLFRVLKEGS